MNMDQAEAMLQTHRVEEISDKIELATITKKLKRFFKKILCCNLDPGLEHEQYVDDEQSAVQLTSICENGQTTRKMEAGPIFVRI